MYMIFTFRLLICTSGQTTDYPGIHARGRHRDPSIYDIGGLGRLVSEESLHRGQRSKRQITITMRIDFSPCNDFNFPSTAPGLDVNELHQARFTNGHVPTHTRN